MSTVQEWKQFADKHDAAIEIEYDARRGSGKGHIDVRTFVNNRYTSVRLPISATPDDMRPALRKRAQEADEKAQKEAERARKDAEAMSQWANQLGGGGQ